MAKVVIVCDGHEVQVEGEHSVPATAKLALSILREIRNVSANPLSAGFGLVTELSPDRETDNALARG